MTTVDQIEIIRRDTGKEIMQRLENKMIYEHDEERHTCLRIQLKHWNDVWEEFYGK